MNDWIIGVSKGMEKIYAQFGSGEPVCVSNYSISDAEIAFALNGKGVHEPLNAEYPYNIPADRYQGILKELRKRM